MKKIWFDEAWEDYTYWQTQDKKTLKRINILFVIAKINKFYFYQIIYIGRASCMEKVFI